MMTANRLSVFFALLAACALIAPAHADSHAGKSGTDQRAVLVTGATSGIGLAITELLAERGHYVYAGGRKPEDIARLSAMDNVEGIRLDVTVQEDIDAAVAHILKQGKGLYGVVNNAGVGLFGAMNEMPKRQIDTTFDVNIYGPWRVNRAFTPLLDESNGRTLIIGSISGFISGNQAGTYAMSKFAVEAYSEALAAELEERGITVMVVEPGGYKSEIREKAVRAGMGVGNAPEEELTEEQLEQLTTMRENNAALKEPTEVAEAVHHALFSDEPKFRYMVVPNAEQAEITVRSALKRVVQLNRDQPYEYSSEQLIEMLNTLIAEEESAAEESAEEEAAE